MYITGIYYHPSKKIELYLLIILTQSVSNTAIMVTQDHSKPKMSHCESL